MARLLIGLSLCVLAACGGTNRAYLGSVSVQPDQVGAVAGAATSNVTIVQDGDNGFVYGFARNLDPRLFVDPRASSSDTANLAFSGVLPVSDFGAVPTSGSARFSGDYAVVVVDGYARTADASRWEVTEDGGPFFLRVNFANGAVSGNSSDGKLTVSVTPEEGLTEDDRLFASGIFGDVEYDGINGLFDGTIGANGAVASFQVEDNARFAAGGFLVTDE